MHLLRHVDHLEPGRERADQLACRFGRAALRTDDELDGRIRIAGAPTDRGLAVSLDRVEQRLAALLLDDLTHEIAERMHVIAQRGVLERKEDPFACHGFLVSLGASL